MLWHSRQFERSSYYCLRRHSFVTLRHVNAATHDRLSTRSVAPIQAGERLLATRRPALDGIDAELRSLSELRDRPVGSIRITASEHAARTVLWQKLVPLLEQYPDIQVELSIDSSFMDIVADRFDAGLRLGGALAKA